MPKAPKCTLNLPICNVPAPDLWVSLRRCERQLASRRPTPQRQSQRGSFVSHFLALLAMLGVGGSSLSDPFSPGLAGGRAQRMCMVSLVPLTWTLPRTPYTVDACDGAPPDQNGTGAPNVLHHSHPIIPPEVCGASEWSQKTSDPIDGPEAQ